MSKCIATIMIALTSTSIYAAGGQDRFVRKLKISPEVTAVIAESDLEARSIGSFSVNLYSSDAGEKEGGTTFFTGGLIHKRDGTIEKVSTEDVDRDGKPEIIVVVRSVGTGGHLSAHAFSVGEGGVPELAATAVDLAADADPVEELKKSDFTRRRTSRG